MNSALQRVQMFSLFAFAFFVPCSIAGAHISLGLLTICVIVQAARHGTKNNPAPLHEETNEAGRGKQTETEGHGARGRAGVGWKLGVEWPIIFFVLIAFASTAFSEKPFDSFRNMRHLLTLLGVYTVAYSLRSYPQWRRPLLWTFIGSATLFSIFGLWKYAAGITSKVQSTQGTTMTWGALCVIFIAVTLQIALSSPHVRDRWLARGFVMPQALAMLLSLVRGAYVGLFCSAVYMLRAYWADRRILLRRVLPAVAAISLAAALFAPAVVRDRISLIFDVNVPSTQVRLVQWKYALQIAADHPIVGVGWRDMLEIFKRYAPQDIDVPAQVKYDIFHIGHFHNSYIMVLACFGMTGLVAFLWLLLAVWRQLTSAELQAGTAHDRVVISASRAAMAGFLVASFFDWTFGDAEVVTMFWFTVGLGLGQVGAKEIFSTEHEKLITSPDARQEAGRLNALSPAGRHATKGGQ